MIREVDETTQTPTAEGAPKTHLKYSMVAWAARAFSLSPQTRTLYRRLGNLVLERQRLRDGLPPRYVERAKRLLTTCDKYGILHEHARVFEVGTGWVHWEATILGL